VASLYSQGVTASLCGRGHKRHTGENQRALAVISPDPIEHLVNTRWHFDHTDGNAWLHPEGATIPAHENTRRRLSMSTRVKDGNLAFPESPAGAIPKVTFRGDHTLPLDGATVALEHYGPAHTDGDISADFTDAMCFT